MNILQKLLPFRRRVERAKKDAEPFPASQIADRMLVEVDNGIYAEVGRIAGASDIDLSRSREALLTLAGLVHYPRTYMLRKLPIDLMAEEICRHVERNCATDEGGRC